MRKFYIFSISVALSLVVGVGFAQAETIAQTIPVKIEQQSLFSNFLGQIKETFLPQVLAESFSDTLGGNFGNIFCAQTSSDQICTTSKQLRSNIKICTFKDDNEHFDFACDVDSCHWQPKANSYVCGYDVWKIKRAELKTAYLNEGTQECNQCQMTLKILSGSSKIERATPPLEYCIQCNGDTNIVSAEFDDSSKSSGLVEVRAELNPRFLDQVGTWYGELYLEGTRPGIEKFEASGKNYATGQQQKVVSGQTLEICEGEQVSLKWNTSDAMQTHVYVGSPQAEYTSGNGNQSFTPTVNTNIYISVSGYAGKEYIEFLFKDPINITLHSCSGSGGSSPWVDIDANPTTINQGETSTLTWTSGNTTSCWAVGNSSDWNGDKLVNGSAVVTPSSTRYYGIRCTDDTTNVTDDVQINVNGGPLVPVGSLNVKIFLDDVEITNVTDVSFNLTEAETITVTEAPQTISDVPAGTYILGNVTGGPEESTFLNFSPTPTITILANQTANLSLYFTSDQGRCNITVQATKYSCDATSYSPWTGALSYGLIGPIILNGTAVDQTFENVPAGRYYLTSLVGGPGTYNGVTPGNPISCPSGGNVNVMMKFKVCPTDNYKCNYSTGRCDLCESSSEECKYNDLPACNIQCSECVDPHPPKANVFCWANYDSESDPCIGVNDNDPNTPSVILYDRSTDSCGDPRTCLWEIFDSSGKLLKTANTCAPYTWYDETPGTYTGKITVTDSQDDASTDTQQFIIKNVDNLICNFAWDPNAPTVSGTTGFFDQTLTPSGTTLKSWKWTFQDASPASSTAQTISNVVFNSAGTKNVTLTVKNSANKTCTITKSITVKTINPYWREVIPF